MAQGAVPIPVEFDDIVDEIVACTELPRDEVRRRVWLQAVDSAGNVVRDVPRFGVTPHEYDDNLARLYRESDSFIFETLVYWARPDRQRWIAHAADRLDRHARARGKRPADLTVLMCGDGTGNDTLFLVNRGYVVDYFELPGSRTFAFSSRRFARAGLLGGAVRLVTDYDAIRPATYDAVFSFEVLEHLPDPRAAIRDLAAALRTGGIALITEAFGAVAASHPTHLRSTCALRGKTAFLFAAQGLALTWYHRERLFKPMEFTKRATPSRRDLVALLRDPQVLRSYGEGRYRVLRHFVRRYVPASLLAAPR